MGGFGDVGEEGVGGEGRLGRATEGGTYRIGPSFGGRLLIFCRRGGRP